MTEAELDALVERYTPPPIPKCRVCGGELAISSIGGGKPTQYRCAAQELFTPEFTWEHYEQSGWEDRLQGGDARVVELVAAYRALKS